MIDRRHWTPAADAAEFLEIDEATIRDWCRRIESGIPTKIRRSKKDSKGRWYVSILEIYNLSKKFGLLRLEYSLEKLRSSDSQP